MCQSQGSSRPTRHSQLCPLGLHVSYRGPPGLYVTHSSVLQAHTSFTADSLDSGSWVVNILMRGQRELGWCPREKPWITRGRWEWGKRRGGQDRAAAARSRYASLLRLEEGCAGGKALWCVVCHAPEKPGKGYKEGIRLPHKAKGCPAGVTLVRA